MKRFIKSRTIAWKMEEIIIDKLILNSRQLINWSKKFSHTRNLFQELGKIDEEYFIGIKGLRGVGKTVLVLQFASKLNDCVYFSADSSLIKTSSLYEVIHELTKRGMKNILIDEIHRKPNWDQDIKTVYDEHKVRIIFSGSSALDLTKNGADLSRRVILKELKPVSFREFLNLRKGFNIPIYSLKEVIENKKKLTEQYAEIASYLNEYLEYGGVLYPEKGFSEALENALRKVIMEDLSALREISLKYETDVYKLLYLIAKSPPFEVNYSSIARELEVSKTMAIRLVQDLKLTSTIITVFPCEKKGINIRKEPKIYLTIPFRVFFSRQGVEINKGAQREEFFVNHFNQICYLKGVRGEKTPDFRVDNLTVEVGGEAKTNYQKPDYIAVDGISTVDNKIPLFLFGFVR